MMQMPRGKLFSGLRVALQIDGSKRQKDVEVVVHEK